MCLIWEISRLYQCNILTSILSFIFTDKHQVIMSQASRGSRSSSGRRSTISSSLVSFLGLGGAPKKSDLADKHGRTKEELLSTYEKDEDGKYKSEAMENLADDLLDAVDENKRLNAEITQLNQTNEELGVTNTSLLNTITRNAKMSKRMIVGGFVLLLLGGY